MLAVEGQVQTETHAEIAQRISKLLPSMSAFQQIAVGWSDALMFDHQFIEPKIKLRRKAKKQTKPATADAAKELSRSSVDDLLSRLAVNGSARELEASLHLLDNESEAMVLRDDFWQCPAEDLVQRVRDSFLPDRFNLLIVGAGPVGSLLASGLKRELGDAIDILLLESRISEPHLKMPYTRRWQTNIPMALFENLIHPSAAKACANSGDGVYMGVDICTLETLALLSAREAGVRCLFSRERADIFVQESPIHLAVDASGSKWLESAKGEQSIHRGVQLDNPSKRYNGYVNFGLVRAQAIPGEKIDVLQRDGWLYPLYREKPIKQALLKLSDAPIELYPSLLQWVQANNSDSKFYLWPGRKKEEINRLLVLVNLTPRESEAFNKFLSDDVPLLSLLKWPAFKDISDPRLQELVRLIYSAEGSDHRASVSKPFLYEPRMLDPDSPAKEVAGIPVLPVGDSFFCGNPKSGNGLGLHLKHLQLLTKSVSTALK